MNEDGELYITEYQLFTKKEENLFSLGGAITMPPFVRLYISKGRYEELGEVHMTAKNTLRDKVDLYLESLIKQFVEEKGMKCNIIGYEKNIDLSDDVEERGYYVKAYLNLTYRDDTDECSCRRN